MSGVPFEPDDNFWRAIWKCRDRTYRRRYIEWLRFGPREADDAAAFERHWTRADTDGQQWVRQYYLDQRANKQTSLMHLKTDAQTLFNQIGLVFVLVSVAIVALAPEHVQAFLQSRTRLVLLVLPIAWYLASSSHTPNFFYTMTSHFIGVATYSEDVIDEKTYTDKVRREANNLSRIIQKGRRRFGMAMMLVLIIVSVITLAVL